MVVLVIFGMMICMIAGFGTMGLLIAKMKDEIHINVRVNHSI